MQDLNLELIEIIVHCCDVKTFRFALEQDVLYKPGQYLILTLDVDGRKIPKALSISSSPTEKGYIAFTKKMTQSPFSRQLDQLRVGQVCCLRLPMGKFTFEGEFEKVAFLSGGIGVTPIRSIFKNAVDKGLSSDVVLLYSGRVPEQLLFRNDFATMCRENKHLNVVYTLTHCDSKIEGCRTGYIDAAMIKDVVPDYKERHFFICGPPAMVDAMRDILLKKLFVPQVQLVTEDFLGY